MGIRDTCLLLHGIWDIWYPTIQASLIETWKVLRTRVCVQSQFCVHAQKFLIVILDIKVFKLWIILFAQTHKSLIETWVFAYMHRNSK